MSAMDTRQSWFRRLLHPDNRNAQRQLKPSLVAHCWTGGAPKAIEIRDISSSGLYLITDERWYVGTVIKLTVQRLDCDQNGPERSIAVRSRVVRCHTNGVGLRFIVDMPNDAHGTDSQMGRVADRRTLSRFLELVTTKGSNVTINPE